ncbi:hypothetical protein [Amycolatopsis tolypomycina]|uniref:hypothetical protein n=1 Tax=Amycolatopsis tolypomycina TaxID=208445 RepID=UPI00339F8A40
MLLAVLLCFGGAPTVPTAAATHDAPAVATTPSHDLISGRHTAPRAPATIPWAVTPPSSGAPTAAWRSRVENPGAAPALAAPPTSRSTRAPPSFAS